MLGQTATQESRSQHLLAGTRVLVVAPAAVHEQAAVGPPRCTPAAPFARRAERHALRVDDANPEIGRYLNRLSDLLFILGRAANRGEDQPWDPGRHDASAG
ncbi:MAG: hypothetical protein DLM67_09650 [Candidatus Nephthysia bennettiae]|uniref:ATP:cob(I)alamin adenosyltransferase n=1 Tax=Candidatus Nephthysia bennettiae TaxID=3127016 RepID=A0A934N5E4_9BACT|nr:ATP:cob(I)alamin adenosyltransferase [Candidatus Dormibacteraeota bacterium]PZR96311.1 MAG: hypothetical protein DLM67_09650 [Candidatus Dormibacteraeota bacterium]